MKKWLLFIMVPLLCGCSSVKESQSIVDYSSMTRIVERMDSMMHTTQTFQQQVYEKQSALVDSFKHSEVRDTSRIIFLGQKGDTIKETTIIKEYIEREHSTQESSEEWKEEVFIQMDSIISTNKSLEQKMDSILREREKNTLVEEKASWYERWFNKLAWLLLIVVIGILAATVIRKRIKSLL